MNDTTVTDTDSYWQKKQLETNKYDFEKQLQVEFRT